MRRRWEGRELGVRSVELRVKRWRRELKAQKRATVRFETAPGHQMQIDFGDTRVWLGGERLRTRHIDKMRGRGHAPSGTVIEARREKIVSWLIPGIRTTPINSLGSA